MPLVCLACFFPFYMFAYLGKDSRSPMHFWNGDDEKLKKAVSDVPAYNRDMAAAYRRFSFSFLLCGAISPVSPAIGILTLLVLCSGGFYLLWRKYQRILAKYSVHPD